MFSEVVSLARLVEAEIVFPLFRDSHQYGRGLPHRAIDGGAWEISEFYQADGGRVDFACPYKG